MLKKFFLDEDNKVNVSINAVILFLVTLIGASLNLHYGHECINDDFCLYIGQASAFLDGSLDNFIRDNAYITSHSWMGMSLVMASWGFPLMLAAVMKLGGEFMHWKMIGVVSLCFCVVLVYLLALKRSDRWIAFTAAMFVALSSELVVGTANKILSDIPYCMFALLGLYLLELMGSTQNRKHEYTFAVLLGVCAAYASEVRSNGHFIIFTFVSLAFAVLLANKYRCFALLKNSLWNVHFGPFITAIAVYMACLVGIRLMLPSNFESFHMFSKFRLSAVPFFCAKNFCAMGQTLFQMMDEIPSYLIYFIFIYLVLYGYTYTFRKNSSIFIYSVASFTLYVVWQYFEGARYLYSVMLASLPVAASGFNEMKEHHSRSCRVIAVAAWALLCFYLLWIGCNCYQNVVVNHREYNYGSFTADSGDIYRYIIENTSKNDIIFYEKPRLLYLCTGRLGFIPKVPSNEPENISAIPLANYVLTTNYIPGSYNLEMDIEANRVNMYLEKKYKCTLKRCYKNASYNMWKVVPIASSPNPAH
ncbi:MAG: phospholipid carrier-dependent glycosyltransferase [bacterium]|nr:phospholipid carrier-dependent glycosyltransferase [bacterium]